MGDEKKQNLHEGHRLRVKERFLKHGVESFNEVQLLETLLFYAIPKKDTNDTAHLLLNTFGSFKKVFEADYNDLVKVNGIGDNAASLIKFFQMSSKRYLELVYTEKEETVNNAPEALMNYCKQLFLGEKRELIYVIALDSELVILERELINEGDPDTVYMPYRKITDFVHRTNASRIVITHNHPNGLCLASKNDVETTKNIVELMNQIEVEVVDHIVVGKNGASSIRNGLRGREVWRNEFNGKF